MRVAAIYDIHGNLPALEAVLQDIARAAVDLIVVGGDVLAGPMPRETLACLHAIPTPVRYVQGNADREVLAQMRGDTAGAVPEPVRALTRWVAQQLAPADASLIASWPLTLEVDVQGLGKVLFCHASPRSDVELFTRLTPPARLAAIFAGVEQSVVVCGHTHMQFDLLVGALRVVNAGSVGMAYGAPGAYWLMLGPGVELRRTDYDRASAAAQIRATAYPLAEDFAATNVLELPSEAEALAVFGEPAAGATDAP